MTTEQIIEGNKLIAMFMGWKDVINHTLSPDISTGFKNEYPRFTSPCGTQSLSYYYEDFSEVLLYHNSWSWLMPVVEKIESIGQTYVEFGKKHCRIQPILYNAKKDCMEWQILHETQCATKIESVYTAITSFITWYNQQPK